MRIARNAFNKSQNQINIQCGVLVREAKRVQSLFSKEFLALVVNACIAKAGKKIKGSFRAWQNSNHARMKKTSQMSCVCRWILHEHNWVKYFLKKTCFENIFMLKWINEFRLYESSQFFSLIRYSKSLSFWSR